MLAVYVRWTTLLSTLLAALFALSVNNLAQAEPSSVNFNQHIRPILSRHCIACHGPDEEDRQADLRLDTFAGATQDLGGYAAIQPGDVDQSELIVRVLTDDPDLRMPPADHADALAEDEISLLKQWIEQGAAYQTHWSFTPPALPAIPSQETFPTADDRINNPIDAFILRRVAAAGLQQNPPAQPRALIRRVSLDLTGLPPTAHEEVVQQSIEAYLEKPTQERLATVVDRLFDTYAYAEHWSAVWLDIARYADTVGYSGDEQRDIWPWRDWLIRSLHANKSYKDLSIEMLAGDLLPNATDEQRLATAFHRNTLSNNEGGTNDEEFRTIAIKDRLSTTINAWMGLTVRCAECHSHKYDPISQKEYYQLLDFFNQTVDSDKKDERPKLAVRPEPDPVVVARLNAKIEELEQKVASQPQVWTIRRPTQMKSLAGTKFELLNDDSILATGPNPNVEEYSFTFALPAGEKIQAIRLEALPHIKYDNNVGRSPEGAFLLSQVRLVKQERGQETRLQFAAAENDYHQVNHHVSTTIRETVKSGAHKQGWGVNHPVSGYKAHHEAIFELKKPFVGGEGTQFTFHLRFDPPWPRLNLGCVRIATCNVSNAAKKYKKRELDPERRKIRELIAERDDPVRVPVMEELPPERRRKTFVMLRGNFQSQGEEVTAQFPQSFLPDDSSIPNDRLGLTQWLFADENPLTARVAVNRHWSRIMGIGLVETEEDFGTQGTPPSHPELLDYLAVQFRESGWDIRQLLKQIVLSATYQQSPQGTRESLEQDPRNRLLSRGPRVRLPAEVVRDQALAVSGLLSNKRFGRPVYPPSPIKRVVNAFTGGMTWQESEGEDRYRRAIYTYLKRSAPHPLFETFDMSSRDVCSMRRLRTNTPLQSFMTLNDITFIEAARALAEKMVASSMSTNSVDAEAQLEQQLTLGLQAVLYNEGNRSQREVLTKLYHKSVSRYQTDLFAAAELVGQDTAEFDPVDLVEQERAQLLHRAALTVVANVMLNLDGFLNN